MRNIVCWLLIFGLLSCSADEETQIKLAPSQANHPVLDTIFIAHSAKLLHIPFKSKLNYGRQSIIRSDDSARVIAVLIDPGQKINKNDLIFGLWLTGKKEKFFSRDILSPFSGTVIRVFIKTGQQVLPATPLALIVDNNFLKITLHMKKSKLKYIKKGQTVFLNQVEKQMTGFVQSVTSDGTIKIMFKNRINAFPINRKINGYIVCGMVRGGYIPNHWFRNRDSIDVFIDKESSFPVYKIGEADSFALLSSPLNGFDSVLIKK